VHRRGHHQGVDEVARLAELARDERRVVRHALDVGAGLGVAEFCGARQPGDGLALAVNDFGGSLAHLVGEHLRTEAAGEVRFAQLQHVAHADLELAPVDRLGQEVAGAAVECFVADGALVARGDHQDRQVVAVAARTHGADEGQAVHARHHVVDDDEVGLVVQAPGERRRRLLEGGGAGSAEPVDELAHQGQVERRVVDDGHLQRAVGWAVHGRSIGRARRCAEELLRSGAAAGGRDRIRLMPGRARAGGPERAQAGRLSLPSVLNW